MSIQRSIRLQQTDYDWLVMTADTQSTTVSTLVRRAIELLRDQHHSQQELKGYSVALHILEANIKANQKRLKELEEATK